MRTLLPRSDAGFTLVELLVAACIAIVLGAVTCWLVVEARTMIDMSREKVDVEGRCRVGVEAIARAMREAGAGVDRGASIGPLRRWLPAVWPGRSDRTAPSTAITIVRALSTAVPATLSADAPDGTPTLAFERDSSCTLPCGFHDGMTIVVFDGRGDFDFFALVSTDGATATVRRLNGGTHAAYRRGVPAIPVELRTYYWRDVGRELRADDGDRGDFPVVNEVVGMAFEYFGDPLPPTAPRPPAGDENCLYDSSGAPRPALQSLPTSGGTFAPLDAALFADGPWCGTGTSPFDADLLRIRSVRLVLRLQASDAAFRGRDTRWFRNPGTASDPARFVKDVVIQTTISPRNLGSWR